MSQVVRIWVKPVSTGRLTGWAVRCWGCKAHYLLPLRTKTTALAVANQHSKEVHDGAGVIAVKKQ